MALAVRAIAAATLREHHCGDSAGCIESCDLGQFYPPQGLGSAGISTAFNAAASRSFSASDNISFTAARQHDYWLDPFGVAVLEVDAFSTAGAVGGTRTTGNAIWNFSSNHWCAQRAALFAQRRRPVFGW